MNIIENLKTLLQNPNLSSKKWISSQYDSQVMNDTLQIGGDAGIVRVRGTKKALAISTDCTPRYVEADPFEGAKQAVAETYRNISAVGATPLAITNCLNFGNPQKPEIMGQIVRAIKGINEACIALDYPVISGNVSLYNETDGAAIQPTPAIGGVGLLKDYEKRCDTKFKALDDEIFVIGDFSGHLDCSIFEAEILKKESKKNPPKVDLKEEKKNAEFVRSLISKSIIASCHDISDGGLLVCLFEMCDVNLGCEIDVEEIKNSKNLDDNQIFFGEEQSRYVISIDAGFAVDFIKEAEKNDIKIHKIGKVIKEKIDIGGLEVKIKELIRLNELTFDKKFNN